MMSLTTLLCAILALQPADRGDALLAGLKSPDWVTRADSADALQKAVQDDESWLANASWRAALAQLLKFENAGIRERYRRGETSEGFAEYYSSTLIPLSFKFLEHSNGSDHELLAGLVNGAYNPDSEMVKRLAMYNHAVAPLALELARDPWVIARWRAYSLLGELVRSAPAQSPRSSLVPHLRQQVREALRAGLLDSDPSGRSEAIQALVKAGDTEAIPLLMQLAQHDPDRGTGGPADYSVRRQAAVAAEKLKALPK